MREFVDKNGAGWNYGEKDVTEPATGKEFVLTQPKRIYNEDYYNITRAIAVENVPVDVVPEPDFFVYKISYMPDGFSLCERIVDEDTAEKLIGSALKAFLRGEATEHIKKFFGTEE